MDWNKITAELAKPLDTKHVKPPAPGKYGDYIEGWHAIAEANRIFGFDGWSYEVTTLAKTNAGEAGGKFHVGYTAMVTVRVGDVSRQDVGHGQGHSKAEGEAHDSAVKEAVTDALKRSLRTFGNPFGLALYDKQKTNVVDGDRVLRDCADLEACASSEELHTAWARIFKAWDRNPPTEIEATKDTMKTKLQEEAA